MHVFLDWRWLGSARDEAALHDILETQRGDFDLDIYRLLAKRLPRAIVIPLTP